MPKSKVLFLMTGSIACYKACHVISRLVQNNCEVQVVASAAALQFIGPATIEGLTGKTVVSDLYAPGSVMDHIHFMRWADLILVAPATANFINKAAAGLGDDLVSTLFLAHDFKRPFLVAPAMNTSMYLHPTTQSSLKKLTAMKIEILETVAGSLACGEEGFGRLLEPDEILSRTLEALKLALVSKTPPSNLIPASNRPVKILITAGGTREPIDTVRVISNISSGRTGGKMAEAFVELGCEVLLLRAQGSFAPSDSVNRQDLFTTFDSLDNQLKKYLGDESFTHVLHTAAVSDYSLESIDVLGENYASLELKKISSDAEKISLHLKRNPKIVDSLKKYSKNKSLNVIAFKLTSQATKEQRLAAVQKLQSSSHAEFVVHNDLSEIDIKTNDHCFTIFSDKSGPITCKNLNQLIAELSIRILPEVLI